MIIAEHYGVSPDADSATRRRGEHLTSDQMPPPRPRVPAPHVTPSGRSFTDEDVAALIDELTAAIIQRNEARQALLEASAAADLALAPRAEWFADGYRAAFEAGRQVGYGQAVHAWKITNADVGWNPADPSFAELDRLRYPPGGRVSWLIPRLGDLYELWTAHAEGGR